MEHLGRTGKLRAGVAGTHYNNRGLLRMLLLQSAPSNPLNDATWLFPALECWHILGFALSVGTIAIVDFRLLGIGMLRQTSQELAQDLAPWTLFGIASMLLSGPLMFATDPDMYYLNHSF